MKMEDQSKELAIVYAGDTKKGRFPFLFQGELPFYSALEAVLLQNRLVFLRFVHAEVIEQLPALGDLAK